MAGLLERGDQSRCLPAQAADARSKHSRPRISRGSSAPTSCASRRASNDRDRCVRITRPTRLRRRLPAVRRSTRREAVVRLRRVRSGCVVRTAGDLRSRAATGLAAGSRGRARRARAAAVARRAPAGRLADRRHAAGPRRQARCRHSSASLIAEGWRVEAEGRLYRRPGAVTLDVRSGIDWFELHGGVDFDGVSADLPDAARRGAPRRHLRPARRRHVRTAAGGVARTQSGAWPRSARPRRTTFASRLSQAALLDAWLADAAGGVLRRGVRARARRAGAIRGRRRRRSAADVPRRAARLSARRARLVRVPPPVRVRRLPRRRDGPRQDGHGARGARGPAPRARARRHVLAARRSSSCRVRSCSTGSRRRRASRRRCACSTSPAAAGATPSTAIGEHDIVLTTYGTLRRDIGHLKEIAFDYAILDEAQAIKNARTSSAKAARLLTADHRLALSGTPVENHLGELWSLFDFLNPGHARRGVDLRGGERGRARRLTTRCWRCWPAGSGRSSCGARRNRWRSELPARTEQTLYCDLEPPQRALYDELRDHYRAALLGKVGARRPRPGEAADPRGAAAPAPGGVPSRPGRSRARPAIPSAKLDVLVPRLQELVEDGRKVLVFSQFTTLLGLLRTRLDEANLTYEYLDGKTRDREARVAAVPGRAAVRCFSSA